MLTIAFISDLFSPFFHALHSSCNKASRKLHCKTEGPAAGAHQMTSAVGLVHIIYFGVLTYNLLYSTRHQQVIVKYCKTLQTVHEIAAL